MDSKSNKEFGRTIWDFIYNQRKLYSIILLSLIVCLTLLITFEKIQFGYNEHGLYFHFGSSEMSLINETSYTHTINSSHEYHGINFRARALSPDELKRAKNDEDFSNESLITWLHNGQKVILLSTLSNWYKIKTNINDKIVTGFISNKYLGYDTLKKIENNKYTD